MTQSGAGSRERGFSGQTAIVTGGAGGIGSAVALRLADGGASVVVVDRNPTRFDELEAQLRERAGGGMTLELDPGRWDDAVAMTETCIERFGTIDILVNSTGIVAPQPFLELTPDNWRAHMSSHLDAYFHSMRSVAPEMATRRYGRIVNMASVAGLMGPVDLAPYSTAKSGIIGLTRAASVELADAGITVNAVAPGPIETPMLTEAWSAEALAARAQHMPIARWGTPTELADVVVFLARRETSLVTGVVLPVDGGSVAAGAYMVEMYRRRTQAS